MAKKPITQRVVSVTNGKQTREIKWNALCWEYIGAVNADEIVRIDKELTTNGTSVWIAPDGNELTITPVDWWPSHD
jgi:hypothetical protein